MRFLLLAMLLLVGVGCADASAPGDEARAEQVADSAQVQQRLEQAFPGIPVDEVVPSEIPGWWTVRVEGEYLEVSPTADYVLSGVLFDVRSGSPVNLTDQRAAVGRAEKLSAVPLSEQIIFKADNEQHRVYVFTDHTCGFCQRLHEQMKGYNDLGISIHYLAFPRGGPDALSAEVLNQVWCAQNRQQAMTEAKRSGQLKTTSPACESPVRRHYALGRELGIRGTPAIFTVSGEAIPGYRAPAELVELLAPQQAQ